jgi:hypothetical protein
MMVGGMVSKVPLVSASCFNFVTTIWIVVWEVYEGNVLLITPYAYIIAYPRWGKSQSKWGDKINEVGFSFCEQHKCFCWNFFGVESPNVYVHQLLNANSWPKSFNNKSIQHHGSFKFLNQHQNMWEVGCVLQIIISPPA